MSSIQSPIDLQTTTQSCTNKCSYKFDYGISDCKVTNKTDHLLLSYNGTSTNVTYNDSPCTVREVRLYKPSLNEYYGSKVDAEIIINHSTNGGNNLLVCVPIKTSSTKSASSTMMESIIRLAPISEDEGQHSVNVPNYTLNNLIPSAPFYNYQGTLPYDEKNGTYDIIIFDSNANSTNINILPVSMETLGTIIEPTNSVPDKSYKTSQLYYNKDGTTEPPSSDDIYIDCQLIDENGEAIVDAETGNAQVLASKSFNDELKELFENPYFDTILGIGAALIIAYYIKKYLDN